VSKSWLHGQERTITRWLSKRPFNKFCVWTLFVCSNNIHNLLNGHMNAWLLQVHVCTHVTLPDKYTKMPNNEFSPLRKSYKAVSLIEVRQFLYNSLLLTQTLVVCGVPRHWSPVPRNSAVTGAADWVGTEPWCRSECCAPLLFLPRY